MKKIKGTKNACPVSLKASAVTAVRGGTIAHPIIEAMIKEEPRLVWTPRPRMPSAKIVGKQIDSKKRVKERNAVVGH
jgi:hypothetical protein